MGYGTVIMDTSSSNNNAVNTRELLKSTTIPKLTSEDTILLNSEKPTIEIATYADTDVYECYIRGLESRIVMRRTNNDWINITQIFKLASFSKTKRTKVLEKESNDIEHEKVQGGYGRFQGTWIPLESAKYLVRKYDINDPVVSAILNFKPDPNNLPPKRSKNSVLKKTSPGTRIQSPSSYNKTPKKKSMNASTNSSGSGVKKSKKSVSSSFKQVNPSPLQNLVFQTPQQPHLVNQNVNTTTTAGSLYMVENNRTMSTQESENHPSASTPSVHEYSATQKPLQFYPLPTNLTNQQKAHFTDSRNIDSNTTNDKPNSTAFLPFIPEVPNNSNTFLSSPKQQQSRLSSDFSVVNNKHKSNHSLANIQRKKTKKIKKKDTLGSTISTSKQPQQPANIGDISNKSNAQDPRGTKQPLLWQNFNQQTILSRDEQNSRNTHSAGYSNGSSIEMFSSNDHPSPLSSRSVSPERSLIASSLKDTTSRATSVLSIEEYKDMILQVLSSENCSDKDYTLPPQMYNPPPKLDVNFEVDAQGHTPLHWAAAMANIPLIKLLIALNANALQCNARGFNCVTKLVFYNNCYKAGTFAEILSLLRVCLVTPDANGRLPLHYLVELSVNKSKDPQVINFYLDTIIENLGTEDYTLLKMCLNYQDNLGNTVLHLSALNLNLELCNKLSSLGSSMDVTNFDNQTPNSILSKYNLVPPYQATSPGNSNQFQLMKGVGLANAFTSPLDVLPKDEDVYTSNHNRQIDSLMEGSHTYGIEEQPPRKYHKSEDPSACTHKFNDSGRNILSHQDTTALSTIMDDLSNIDELVTSSVVKDAKSSPAKLLANSPMLHKGKLAVAKSRRAEYDTEVPTVVTSHTAFSPSTGAHEQDEGNLSVELAQSLAQLSSALESSVKKSVKNITEEIAATKTATERLIEKIKVYDQKYQDILSDECADGEVPQTIERLRAKKEQLTEQLEAAKKRVIERMERQRGNDIARLIEKEGSKELLPPRQAWETVVSWVLFQKKTKKMMEEQCEQQLKQAAESAQKINQYRRVIGISMKDIDSKLDDLERELQAEA